MSSAIFLSHYLSSSTPSYGNHSVLRLENKRSIACGDHTNESFLHMSVHLGTHIDVPLHFYANGQSIEDFPAGFWIFNHPVMIEIGSAGDIIFQEIVDRLDDVADDEKNICDLLMVKTGMDEVRHLPAFWEYNPGFSPELCAYFKSTLPSLRVFGFDSISLTGFQNRETGKKAHQQFLNPDAPILLLEDMKLDEVSSSNQLKSVMIAPLRLKNCDGLPCTVLGVT